MRAITMIAAVLLLAGCSNVEPAQQETYTLEADGTGWAWVGWPERGHEPPPSVEAWEVVPNQQTGADEYLALYELRYLDGGALAVHASPWATVLVIVRWE
jgi:hypothetical protein